MTANSPNQALQRTFPARVENVFLLGVRKALLAVLVFSSLGIGNALAADSATKPAEEEPLSSLMEGSYDLIGRKPDSTATYSGKIILRADGPNLRVTRTIEGKTFQGTARFDTVAGSDRIPVLRLQFVLDGIEYQAAYCWLTDPDNYFRFTAVIGRQGTKSPGLEAFFPIHE